MSGTHLQTHGSVRSSEILQESIMDGLLHQKQRKTELGTVTKNDDDIV